MGIFSRLFRSQKNHSDRGLTFANAHYRYQGEKDGADVWHTAAGDGLGLYYFAKPPDIPSNLGSVAELRAFYDQQLVAVGVKTVECAVISISEVKCVWLLFKGGNPDNSGAVYVGSLTVPFRNFSWVIKMQCYERGDTGIREAVLTAKALSNGTIKIHEDGKVETLGWNYDDEQFDALFPEHPLSRLRREMKSIISSIRLSDAVLRADKFELPID